MKLVSQRPVLSADEQVANYKRLLDELKEAATRLDRSDATDLLTSSAGFYGRALTNRAGNIVRLVRVVGQGVVDVASEATDATRTGDIGGYLKGRLGDLWDGGRDLVTGVGNWSAATYQRLRAEPGQVAPELITAVLVTILVSGGPDGNGGAPDLDLLMGIGAHRSIFTHSILMGSALEAAILTSLHFVRLVHRKLPAGYDPWWDQALVLANRLGGAAGLGANAGMAYHLFVDGILQPAAYHDLPVHMPMEGHQVIMTGNSVAEAGEIVRKQGQEASRTVKARPDASHAPRQPAQATRPTRPVQAVSDADPRPATPAGQGWRAAHRRYLSKALPVHPRVARAMASDRLRLVEEFGQWFAALEDGTLHPATPEQVKFVAVAKGQLEPLTAHESAWREYRELQARFGLG